MAQRHGRTEVTDQRGKDGAEGPPETIRETLARTAEAGGEKFGEERTDRAKYARGKKSERESQREHHVIAKRPVGIRRDRGEGGRGKENQRRLAAEAVSEMGAGQVAKERARDYDSEITAGIQSGNVQLTFEKGW